MTTEIVQSTLNFEKVELRITLDTLNTFISFESEVLVIQNQLWMLRIEKANKNGIDCISVILISLIGNGARNWAAFAECTVKLISSNLNKEAYSQRSMFVFFDKAKSWGFSSFIEWNKLIDLKNGYVNDDTCIFVITLKMAPFQNTIANDLVLFETFKRSTIAKYRFTIKDATDFFGSCSPELIVNDLPWRIFFHRATNADWQMYDTLQIGLKSLNVNMPSCDISIAWSLIPFDENIQPVKSEKILTMNIGGMERWDLTRMANLFDPQMKFIENDSFVVKVKFKIIKVNGLPKKPDPQNWKKFNCSICSGILFDRSVSALQCGHLFCTDCIIDALKCRNNCPSCNQEVTANPALRPVLLK